MGCLAPGREEGQPPSPLHHLHLHLIAALSPLSGTRRGKGVDKQGKRGRSKGKGRVVGKRSKVRREEGEEEVGKDRVEECLLIDRLVSRQGQLEETLRSSVSIRGTCTMYMHKPVCIAQCVECVLTTIKPRRDHSYLYGRRHIPSPLIGTQTHNPSIADSMLTYHACTRVISHKRILQHLLGETNQ